MRKFTSSIAVVTVVCGSLVLFGQESTDLAVIDRIKSEAFTRSEVMEHLDGQPQIDEYPIALQVKG